MGNPTIYTAKLNSEPLNAKVLKFGGKKNSPNAGEDFFSFYGVQV